MVINLMNDYYKLNGLMLNGLFANFVKRWQKMIL